MKRILIAATALACFATACTSTSTTGTTSDSTGGKTGPKMTDMTTINKQIALAASEAVGSHDPNAVFKDVTPDYIEYADGSSPPVKGADSAKVYFQTFLTAFPDLKGENLTAIAEGNQVAVFGEWSGTFKGELMGMKPTGKSFKFKDVDLYTFNDEGKITEHRSVQSMATILSQVGATMKK